jgi:hypothetical protein
MYGKNSVMQFDRGFFVIIVSVDISQIFVLIYDYFIVLFLSRRLRLAVNETDV